MVQTLTLPHSRGGDKRLTEENNEGLVGVQWINLHPFRPPLLSISRSSLPPQLYSDGNSRGAVV